MRAIGSPHKITLRNMILREKFQKFSIFASIHTSISLNLGSVLGDDAKDDALHAHTILPNELFE
jgi:hypothetical protein